ncbi:hypothetical protein [Corynebacterium auriscanis]|uniref:hypothetical protein n=1 Tax=Corynebacterium auriscanis TaxID=99807 RepID=UPI003CEE98E0
MTMMSIISTVVVLTCFPVTVYLCIRTYLTAEEAGRAIKKARYHGEETIRLLEEQRELRKRVMDRELGIEPPRLRGK